MGDVSFFSSHDIPSRVGSFELLTTFSLEFAPEIRVAKWISSKTGLKVVWADTDGPLIDGGVQVATEIWNDSGCPHTLEHLVFMGSEKFPYKGVLDVLGNRMIGNGTNAWTATNCTNFTMSTASEEGFLRLLPVYMDHILFPTLTKSAFCTEVYHMNGKGDDSGTVLSEMQGSATDVDTLMQLELQRTLYNMDNSNRSETGGMPNALRKLDVNTVRRYHDEMYVPQNITITVIGGAMSPLKFLSVLEREVESSLIEHALDDGENGPKGWKRPFVETRTAENPPSIEEDEIHVVTFPQKDESTGVVTISWIGPRATDELGKAAIEILGNYLADSTISPLQYAFVKVVDPWCTGIAFDSSSADPQIITITLASVPFPKLDSIGDRFKEALEDISETPFDMNRMKNVLRLQKLGLLKTAESNPKSYLSSTIQNDALFGPNDASQLEGAFKDMSNCKILEGWSSSDWTSLLITYFITPNSLTIIGKPSAKLVGKLQARESARIEAIVDQLGAERLAQLDAQVKAAAEANAKLIPPSLIRQYRVPSIATSIKWRSIETARTYKHLITDGGLQRKVEADMPKGFPLDIHFSQVTSAFISISVYLFGDDHVTAKVGHLLPLYKSSFFLLPVNRENGKKYTYDEVIKFLECETVSYSFGEGALRESLRLTVKVETANYSIGIAWLKDLLFGSVFSVDRLKINLSQQLQDLPAAKSDGSAVASAGLSALLYLPYSAGSSSNLISLSQNLPTLMKTLRTTPTEIVNQLEELRQGVTDPRAMRISVVGDILKLKNPVSTWAAEFEHVDPFEPRERIPVIRDSQTVTPWTEIAGEMMIYQVPGIESTYGKFTCRGPKWDSPDLPALVIAAQVLNATEGNLWIAVRGQGLAYGATIRHSAETGYLTFELFKSPDVFAAWKATKDLFIDIISGKTFITDLQVEAAKSMHAYNTAAGEETKDKAAHSAFFNEVLMERTKDFNQQFLARTDNVTLPQVLSVIKRYFIYLFDPKSTVASISSGPSKAKEVLAAFKDQGFCASLVNF